MNTTKRTEQLMAEIRKLKPNDARMALGYVLVEVANATVAGGGTWADRKLVLEAGAEFLTTRAQQCWTDLDLEEAINPDPDEDLL